MGVSHMSQHSTFSRNAPQKQIPTAGGNNFPPQSVTRISILQYVLLSWSHTDSSTSSPTNTPNQYKRVDNTNPTFEIPRNSKNTPPCDTENTPPGVPHYVRVQPHPPTLHTAEGCLRRELSVLVILSSITPL